MRSLSKKNTDSLYDIDLEDGMPSKALELRGTQSELVESSFQKNKEEAILESIPELVHAISQPITDREKRQQQTKRAGRFSILSIRSWLVQLPSQRETFYCEICFENVIIHDQYSLTGEACCHKFCKECLGTHLSIKIRDGEVRNPCPKVGEDDCGNFASEADVQELCAEEVYLKFTRFQKMKSDDNYRECPECGHMQLGKRKRPAMTCEKCSFAYCFFHTNAHPDESCQRYARRIQQVELQAQREVKRISKPCPSCKAPTTKNGGCNHMTCVTCKANWCWICGKNMGNSISRHYEWWNICGCSGAQFQEDFSFMFCTLFKMFGIVAFLVGVPSVIGFGLAYLACIPLLMVGGWAISFCFTQKLMRTAELFDLVFKAGAFVVGAPAAITTLLVIGSLASAISLVTGLIIGLILPAVLLLRKCSRLSGFAPTNARLTEALLVPFKVIFAFFDDF